MQDYDNCGYYYPQNLLNFLDKESNKNESKNDSNKKNQILELDFQNFEIVLAITNLFSNIDLFLKYDFNLKTQMQD